MRHLGDVVAGVHCKLSKLRHSFTGNVLNLNKIMAKLILFVTIVSFCGREFLDFREVGCQISNSGRSSDVTPHNQDEDGYQRPPK